MGLQRFRPRAESLGQGATHGMKARGHQQRKHFSRLVVEHAETLGIAEHGILQSQSSRFVEDQFLEPTPARPEILPNFGCRFSYVIS